MRTLPFKIGTSLLSGVGLDPLYTGTVGILSLDRLTVHNAGGRFVSLTALGFNSFSLTPKLYFEVTVNSGIAPNIGIGAHGVTLNGLELGGDISGWGYLVSAGTSYIYHNSVGPVAWGSSYGAGDIIGVALDLTNSFLYFSKNGVWQNGASSAGIAAGSGVGAAFSGIPISTLLYGAISNWGGVAGNYTLNTGRSAFANTPPAGFVGF